MATAGVGSSGMDVNSIVSQLMTVERQPINKLNAKEAGYQAKLSAYGSVKGALASFQTAVQGLSSASKFTSLDATPSDDTILSATASSIAVAGSYSLEVTSLAQAQKLASAGKSSSTASIGGGAATTVTFDFGTITGNTFNATTGKYGTALSSVSTTNLSTNITVASTSNLAVGAAISGTGIPVGATIASITDATHFVISAAATATGSPVDVQAGATFASSGSGAKNITIDSSNNSLQGIRDAINAAKIGVTATIINDGGASPYRLALSSDSNGASSSMKISVSGDAAVGALLAHDPANSTGQNLNETVTAQNAVLKVNGVAVSKTSNSVSDVIQGVTLNLKKITTSPTTLTVAHDKASISNAVTSFVKNYNDLAKTLKDISAYNPKTKQAAVLQGDSTVRSIQSQLRNALGAPVMGASGDLTTLSQIGVSFQKDGSLALDSAKLNSVMDSNLSDIASLFAATGKATDSLVSYISANSSTKAGSYAVSITQFATKGGITGDLDLTNPTYTIDPSTTMSVALDGVSASVALTAGTTYTPAQLAAMIQSAINGTSAFSSAGLSVAATINSNRMSIVSNKYGLTSNVSMSSSTGTAVSAFMGAVTTGIPGLDVAGTVGGATATGSGQNLTVTSGDPQGLSLTYSGATASPHGILDYSHGYAYLLDKWANTNLDSGGTLASRTEGIGKTVTEIGKQRTAMETRLIGIEKRYRDQFSRLDVMLSNMSQTSNYLTQQLAGLSSLN